MSSSERAPPASLGRGYWRGLAFACAVLLGVVALNVVIDPTGDFGRGGSHALNRRIPASVSHHMDTGTTMSLHRRLIRESDAEVFLIGASRVARGFDTCEAPSIMKVSGSSWGARDLSAAAGAALKDRRTPAILLIEIGLPADDGRRETNRNLALVNAALSPRTTLFSIQTIAANLTGEAGGEQPQPRCEVDAHASDWEAAAGQLAYIQRVVDVAPASVRRGRQIVLDMVERADAVCRATGLHHTLVLFALPPSLPYASTRSFAARAADGLRTLSDEVEQSAGGVDVVSSSET